MPLKNVSASQLNAFKRCERKWYYDKVVRVPRVSTNSQRRGTAIHHALEVYVNTGEILEYVAVNDKGYVEDGAEHVFKTARFVKATIPYLPPAGESKLVEQRVDIPTLDGQGPKWIGYIDLLTESQIIDYKTTSDLRYAKTPDDLLSDTQLCSYAKYVLDMAEDESEVRVTLIYLETRNKIKVRTKEVSVVLTRDRVTEQWEAEQAVIKKMLACHEIEDVEETKFNPAACWDYGGCQYKNICSIPKQTAETKKKEEQKEGQKMSDFLKAIREKKKAGSAAAEASKPEADSIVPPDSPRAKEPKATKKKTVPKEKALEPPKGPKSAKTFCLFIDCLPEKGCSSAVPLDDWLFKVVEKLNAFLQEHKKVADYWLLPFAEQKAVFSTAVVEAIKENPPECMTVRTGTQQTNEALAMLVPFATMVVRGTR